MATWPFTEGTNRPNRLGPPTAPIAWLHHLHMTRIWPQGRWTRLRRQCPCRARETHKETPRALHIGLSALRGENMGRLRPGWASAFSKGAELRAEDIRAETKTSVLWRSRCLSKFPRPGGGLCQSFCSGKITKTPLLGLAGWAHSHLPNDSPRHGTSGGTGRPEQVGAGTWPLHLRAMAVQDWEGAGIPTAGYRRRKNSACIPLFLMLLAVIGATCQ